MTALWKKKCPRQDDILITGEDISLCLKVKSALSLCLKPLISAYTEPLTMDRQTDLRSSVNTLTDEWTLYCSIYTEGQR